MLAIDLSVRAIGLFLCLICSICLILAYLIKGTFVATEQWKSSYSLQKFAIEKSLIVGSVKATKYCNI